MGRILATLMCVSFLLACGEVKNAFDAGAGDFDAASSADASVTDALDPTYDAPPVTHSLSVTLEGNGDGTVSSDVSGIDCGSSCQHEFAEGSSVTLTATPSTGSSFTGWSGGGCVGADPCTVTVNAATSVTATFTLNQYTLTVTKAGDGDGVVTSTPGGIDCGPTCELAFDYNTTVMLGAGANGQSSFEGWSGAGCGGMGSCSVTMTQNRAVTATFASLLCPSAGSLVADGPHKSYGDYCYYLGAAGETCDAVCASMGGTNLADQVDGLWSDGGCAAPAADDVVLWFYNNNNVGNWAGPGGGTSFRSLGYGYTAFGNEGYYGKCSTGTSGGDVGAYPGETGVHASRQLVCACFSR